MESGGEGGGGLGGGGGGGSTVSTGKKKKTDRGLSTEEAGKLENSIQFEAAAAAAAAADSAQLASRPSTSKANSKKKKGNAATPSLKDCANCGASEGTVPGIPIHKPCSRCKITYYCSVKCQKHHWRVGGHKQHCVAEKDRSVAKANAANTKKGKDGSAAEEDICAICQEALSESPSKPLPCSHVYHVACVEKLRSYDIKQVCPTCRVDLPPGPEQLYEEAALRFYMLDRRYGQAEEDAPWRRITNAHDRRENAEMMRSMKEAAEQGHNCAQCQLGIMYRYGQGARQSDALAAEWYRKAADQNLPQAQFNLGQMYLGGLGGLPQSHALAVEWFRKAADQGLADAQYSVAVAYAQGEGVPESPTVAGEWICKAADQGHVQSQFSLGRMYSEGSGGLPQSDVLAVEWYRKAADQGDTKAQYNLALMYEHGRGGLPQSDALAVEWFRKAADQGDAQAHYHLGSAYHLGRGVPQDFQQGLQLLKKAQMQGHEEAAVMVERAEGLLRKPKAKVVAAAIGKIVGLNVELYGLQAKPQLNGQRGVVTGVDVASERFAVKLDDGRGPFHLKPGNLKEVKNGKAAGSSLFDAIFYSHCH